MNLGFQNSGIEESTLLLFDEGIFATGGPTAFDLKRTPGPTPFGAPGCFGAAPLGDVGVVGAAEDAPDGLAASVAADEVFAGKLEITTGEVDATAGAKAPAIWAKGLLAGRVMLLAGIEELPGLPIKDVIKPNIAVTPSHVGAFVVPFESI
jgi:hypothetical protein